MMPELRETHESMDLQNDLSPDYEAEQDRERRWNDFMTTCREFAEADPKGWPAVFRAAAAAMSEQMELPYGGMR